MNHRRVLNRRESMFGILCWDKNLLLGRAYALVGKLLL